MRMTSEWRAAGVFAIGLVLFFVISALFIF
jgi:hypothetical protein